MRVRALSVVTAVAAVVATVGASPSNAAPGGSVESPQHFVQLGDSFSSGNGAGSYVEKTCWRSPNNYGARVAQLKGATYTNAACSGGVTADILEPRDLGSPSWRTRTYRIPAGAVDARAQWLAKAKADQLCGTPAQSDFSYVYTVSSSASAGDLYTAAVRCQLQAAPQIDAVDRSTDAVFVTTGGNDVRFTSIVIDCLVLRSAGSCKARIDAANAQLTSLKQETKETLQAVHDRSGGRAHVYLLGYPHLINTDNFRLGSTYDAGNELSRMQLRGDTLQRAAMAELSRANGGRGGFTFVDVKRDWGGYTHGIDPHVVADNSDAWLVPVLSPGRELKEFVHPTAAGWGASALALADAMR
ncbi:SGNH/GDSL hydrolase family protein [Janibacter sp. G349]|uniref:SGNH/GDSL hydrolase family protein n=1 Tax=unclassified Janibacter TaxID=2649294 RepID=UPI003B77C274